MTTERPLVQLFSDGACIGNPGPGGWAFILRHPKSGREKEGSGGEHHTTNNRMEIMSVIRGLESLKVPTTVELIADSRYVLDAIKDWMPRWKVCGWMKGPRSKRAVKNVDLRRQLDALLQIHEVRPTWTKGHAGHRENERCDQLAYAAATAVSLTPAPSVPADGDALFSAGNGDDEE